MFLSIHQFFGYKSLRSFRYLESSVRFRLNYFVFRFDSGNKVINKLISKVISYFVRFRFCSGFGLKSQKSKTFVLNISFLCVDKNLYNFKYFG